MEPKYDVNKIKIRDKYYGIETFDEILEHPSLTQETFDELIKKFCQYFNYDMFQRILMHKFMNSNNLDVIIDVMYNYDEIFELAAKSDLISLKSLESIYYNKKSNNRVVLINIINNPSASIELKNNIFMDTIDNELIKEFLKNNLVNYEMANSKRIQLKQKIDKINLITFKNLINISNNPLLDEELMIDVINKLNDLMDKESLYANELKFGGCSDDKYGPISYYVKILLPIASSNIITFKIFEMIIELVNKMGVLRCYVLLSELSTNEKLDGECLDKIADISMGIPFIVMKTLQNKNIYPKSIDKILDMDVYNGNWYEAARSINTSKETLKRIATEKDDIDIFLGLIENPNIDEEIKEIIKNKIMAKKFMNEENDYWDAAKNYNNDLRRCLEFLRQ